jgi:hypothetical protein
VIEALQLGAQLKGINTFERVGKGSVIAPTSWIWCFEGSGGQSLVRSRVRLLSTLLLMLLLPMPLPLHLPLHLHLPSLELLLLVAY